MGVIVGVDGGNTKTDVLVVGDDGELRAFVRGGGSNSHGPGGAEGAAAVVAKLVGRAGVTAPVGHGAFFLCGADVAGDIEALERALEPHALVRHAIVDNDTFALLRSGSDGGDAVAVVCGGGFNCVGRAADGRTVRYPSLGWETGDWGGSEMLGREVLFHAARGEDGRGKPTALVKIVRQEFELPTVAAVGEAIHYRRVPEQQLGRLAPKVLAAATAGDSVARALVVRLAEEISLAVWRSLWDLGLIERRADVVLGGGMLRAGTGLLHDEVVARIAHRAPAATVVVPSEPPVLGSALEALRAAGAPAEAAQRLRAAFSDGVEPEDVR
jgi:N-acetylglucosamine kinase-like BadF-type ATPase